MVETRHRAFLFAMPIDYRYARAADAPLLAELNLQLIEDEGSRTRLSVPELTDRMRAWLESGYRAAIFHDADQIAGYAMWRLDGDDLYLRHFFVQRPMRRRGIGRECFELIFTHILAGRRIVLEVLTTNPGGLGFWKSLGFTEYAVTLEKMLGRKG